MEIGGSDLGDVVDQGKKAVEDATGYDVDATMDSIKKGASGFVDQARTALGSGTDTTEKKDEGVKAVEDLAETATDQAEALKQQAAAALNEVKDRVETEVGQLMDFFSGITAEAEKFTTGFVDDISTEKKTVEEKHQEIMDFLESKFGITPESLDEFVGDLENYVKNFFGIDLAEAEEKAKDEAAKEEDKGIKKDIKEEEAGLAEAKETDFSYASFLAEATKDIQDDAVKEALKGELDEGKYNEEFAARTAEIDEQLKIADESSDEAVKKTALAKAEELRAALTMESLMEPYKPIIESAVKIDKVISFIKEKAGTAPGDAVKKVIETVLETGIALLKGGPSLKQIVDFRNEFKKKFAVAFLADSLETDVEKLGKVLALYASGEYTKPKISAEDKKLIEELNKFLDDEANRQTLKDLGIVIGFRGTADYEQFKDRDRSIAEFHGDYAAMFKNLFSEMGPNIEPERIRQQLQDNTEPINEYIKAVENNDVTTANSLARSPLFSGTNGLLQICLSALRSLDLMKQIYSTQPVLNEDGTPKLDEEGNPVMEKTKEFSAHDRVNLEIATSTREAGLEITFQKSDIELEEEAQAQQEELEKLLTNIREHGPGLLLDNPKIVDTAIIILTKLTEIPIIGDQFTKRLDIFKKIKEIIDDPDKTDQDKKAEIREILFPIVGKTEEKPTTTTTTTTTISKDAFLKGAGVASGAGLPETAEATEVKTTEEAFTEAREYIAGKSANFIADNPSVLGYAAGLLTNTLPFLTEDGKKEVQEVIDELNKTEVKLTLPIFPLKYIARKQVKDKILAILGGEKTTAEPEPTEEPSVTKASEAASAKIGEAVASSAEKLEKAEALKTKADKLITDAATSIKAAATIAELESAHDNYEDEMNILYQDLSALNLSTDQYFSEIALMEANPEIDIDEEYQKKRKELEKAIDDIETTDDLTALEEALKSTNPDHVEAAIRNSNFTSAYAETLINNPSLSDDILYILIREQWEILEDQQKTNIINHPEVTAESLTLIVDPETETTIAIITLAVEKILEKGDATIFSLESVYENLQDPGQKKQIATLLVKHKSFDSYYFEPELLLDIFKRLEGQDSKSKVAAKLIGMNVEDHYEAIKLALEYVVEKDIQEYQQEALENFSLPEEALALLAEKSQFATILEALPAHPNFSIDVLASLNDNPLIKDNPIDSITEANISVKSLNEANEQGDEEKALKLARKTEQPFIINELCFNFGNSNAVMEALVENDHCTVENFWNIYGHTIEDFHDVKIAAIEKILANPNSGEEDYAEILKDEDLPYSISKKAAEKLLEIPTEDQNLLISIALNVTDPQVARRALSLLEESIDITSSDEDYLDEVWTHFYKEGGPEHKENAAIRLLDQNPTQEMFDDIFAYSLDSNNSAIQDKILIYPFENWDVGDQLVERFIKECDSDVLESLLEDEEGRHDLTPEALSLVFNQRHDEPELKKIAQLKFIEHEESELTEVTNLMKLDDDDVRNAAAQKGIERGTNDRFFVRIFRDNRYNSETRYLAAVKVLERSESIDADQKVVIDEIIDYANDTPDIKLQKIILQKENLRLTEQQLLVFDTSADSEVRDLSENYLGRNLA